MGVRSQESLVAVAARRAVSKVRREAATPEFGRLLAFQALGAAGDALVALALAGSLFFAVPEATARGKVGLYLALTVAPFAVIAPLLSRVLDRHRGSLRLATVLIALGRSMLAWMLATRLDSLLLFPIGFGLLVLSRAALITRGAMLPAVVPPGRSLVQGNSSLSKASAAAGIIAVPIGLTLVRLVSTHAELLFAAVVFFAGALPAFGLPAARGTRPEDERLAAQAAAASVVVRQALVAAAGMRLLVGFLVVHLAFALRREDVGSLGLGVLVGAAAFGTLVGAIAAPRLRRHLREEGILAVTLALAGIVAIVAGRYFGPVTAGVLVAVFGVASGAAKVAFDAIVQHTTPEAGRGWAFARFESRLQLAWVVGALLPLALAIPAGVGVVAAGVAANLLALLFVVARRRSTTRLP